MIGQFFGRCFGELRTTVPQKGVATGTKEAHESVRDEDKAGEFEKATRHKTGFQNFTAVDDRLRRWL